MRRSRAVQPVVAYVWDLPGLGWLAIPREEFWPGCEIREVDGKRWAWIDWTACPRWDVIDGEWWGTAPDRERLGCGHELPMRTHRKGWYVRPKRLCALCAMGVPAVYQ